MRSRPLRRSRVALFCVSLLLICGCGPGSNAAPKRDPNRFAHWVDQSLPTSDFVRLWLPPPNRVWNGDDYVAAREALEKIYREEGQRRLPRYQSERSGEVFARITSPQNLEMIVDPGYSFGTRARHAALIFESHAGILRLYTDGFPQNQVRDSELVELFGSGLRQMVATLKILEHSMPMIDKGDPTSESRMNQVNRSKETVAHFVMTTIFTLREVDDFRVGERLRLIGHMRETLPVIVPQLSPSSRAEAMQTLEAMQSDPKLKDLQPQLGELTAKLKLAQPADDQSVGTAQAK